MKNWLDYLKSQGLSDALIGELAAFRERYPAAEGERMARPLMPFYGREILEMGICALLKGENLLLSGQKASGKNVLAENLAFVFGRPIYSVSFHEGLGSGELIGTDTFTGGEVRLRPGTVTRCALEGGFGILDEINMARNDAVSVLHACLDWRRLIDIPGYELIRLHDATRFIAAMNVGYAGTRELNEALLSRFLVIDMPPQSEESLSFILDRSAPALKGPAKTQLIGLFLDLQKKAENGEISQKALDLRGLTGAVALIGAGLKPQRALFMGIVNKTFDVYEKEIVADVVRLWIPEGLGSGDVLGG